MLWYCCSFLQKPIALRLDISQVEPTLLYQFLERQVRLITFRGQYRVDLHNECNIIDWCHFLAAGGKQFIILQNRWIRLILLGITLMEFSTALSIRRVVSQNISTICIKIISSHSCECCVVHSIFPCQPVCYLLMLSFHVNRFFIRFNSFLPYIRLSCCINIQATYEHIDGLVQERRTGVTHFLH